MEKENDSTDILINLGFAEKADTKMFAHEKFPSKLGGQPVMLFPIDNKHFTCEFCGGKLTFLLQLYCILEDNPNCYHRTLYLFFCMKCFKVRPAFKCLRLQLPEKSEFYNGTKIKDKKQLTSFFPDLDSINVLKPEYNIAIEEEKEAAIKLFLKISNDFNEGDIKEDYEELEDPQLSKTDTELMNKLLKEYNSQEDKELNDDDKMIDKAEDDFLCKIGDKNTENTEDFIFKFFSNIVKFNSDQIVRYSRDNIKPLWYCKSNIMTNKNIKCSNCGNKKNFEFQVMPFVFYLYDSISNHDIGTIVVYTCECDIMVSEEYVYVQRTGEKLIDLGDMKELKEMLIKDKLNCVVSENIIGGNTDNTPDEDGFVEVKKKKNKDKKELEKICESDNDSFDE